MRQNTCFSRGTYRDTFFRLLLARNYFRKLFLEIQPNLSKNSDFHLSLSSFFIPELKKACFPSGTQIGQPFSLSTPHNSFQKCSPRNSEHLSKISVFHLSSFFLNS